MANRVIRDWTDSERINSLSWQAEVLFTRLVMKADDYGSYHANIKLVKAALFPLRIDTVREADITRWMAECQKAGLIVFYTAESKPYLRIINFNQRMRNMKKRFPDCPPQVSSNSSNSPQSAASRGEPPLETEIETEIETESEKEVSGKKPPDDVPKKEDVTYPFTSENFLYQWRIWKDFKAKEHKFFYKTPQSEQAALNELITLAGGIEENAIAIIHQSMAKGWKGFFELKNPLQSNGQQQSASNNGKQSTGGNVSAASAFSKIDRMFDKVGS